MPENSIPPPGMAPRAPAAAPWVHRNAGTRSGWVLIAIGVAYLVGTAIYRASTRDSELDSPVYQAGGVIGMVLALVLALLLIVRGVRNVRSHGDVAVDRGHRMLAGLLGVIVVAGAGLGIADAIGSDNGPWSTQEGRDMRAGYLAGCVASGDSQAGCECFFEELKSIPRYDTPTKFATLIGELQTAERTGSLAGLSPAVFVAAERCATS